MLPPLRGPLAVFLDTSYLRKVGFGHPDFQKLIEYAKGNRVRLFVSFIAWEERRTQLLLDATSQVSKTRREFDALCRQQTNSFLLQGLPKPSLDIWEPGELEARSSAVMAAFAEENNITVVPLGADHAERAWGRYFRTDPPFNTQETDREKRRKDIPDSWILEAAIDVSRAHAAMVALCCDGRFSAALKDVLGTEVYETTQEILDLIDSRDAILLEQEQEQEQKQEQKQEQELERQPVSAVINPTVESPSPLGSALDAAESAFRFVATKVLGLVSYLGSPPKDKLYEILEGSGISADVSRNTATQLVLAGIISDTGNHYVVANKEAGLQARSAVEPEIIRIATGGE